MDKVMVGLALASRLRRRRVARARRRWLAVAAFVPTGGAVERVAAWRGRRLAAAGARLDARNRLRRLDTGYTTADATVIGYRTADGRVYHPGDVTVIRRAGAHDPAHAVTDDHQHPPADDVIPIGYLWDGPGYVDGYHIHDDGLPGAV